MMKASNTLRFLVLNFTLLLVFSACTKRQYQGFSSIPRQQYDYVSAVQSVEENRTEKVEAPLLVSTVQEVVLQTIHPKVQKTKILSSSEAVVFKGIVKDSIGKDFAVVAVDKKGKSQAAAFIMAIASWYHFAGLVPVHRFYLGGKRNSTAGVLMIIFGVLTLGIVSYFWGLSDWIRILKGTLKPGEGDYSPKFKRKGSAAKSN